MSLGLQVGKVYTFNTLAPAILGAVISNAKLVSVLDFDSASLYETVAIKYQQIYPVVAFSGAPQSPANEVFYRFKTQSGQYIIMADAWIDGTSIAGYQNLTFTATVTNATSEQQDNVSKILKGLGLTFTIAIVPNLST